MPMSKTIAMNYKGKRNDTGEILSSFTFIDLSGHIRIVISTQTR